MKRITAAYYEDEFKTQTGFRPGDPEPTSYEQVAGFFSAIDLAVATNAISKCAAKFIRQQAAKFVRDEFHARLTPDQLVRMVEMGEHAMGAMEEVAFENTLRNLLSSVGMTEDEVDAALSEPAGPVGVEPVVPQAAIGHHDDDWGHTLTNAPATKTEVN